MQKVNNIKLPMILFMLESFTKFLKTDIEILQRSVKIEKIERGNICVPSQGERLPFYRKFSDFYY